MSETAIAFDVNRIPELIDCDTERIEIAKQRQCAVWEGRKPDKWPGFMWGCRTDEQKEIPQYNFKEAFYDKEKMLCSQIGSAISTGRSGSDGVPSIRVNFGTGTLLSCFGLEQEIYEDKMPWLLTHLSKEEASKLDPEKIESAGTFARGLEVMKYYKEILGDKIAIYPMDTQGPFDLAHLLIGDDIFYQMHDDPQFVHHIMEVCLALNIKTHEWMKEIAGEPLDKMYHGNEMYAENMGIRICEDTTALLGPDDIAKYAMPYTQRAAQHFGGAWVHYCGRNDHLTKAVLDIPEIVAINFGHIPGHMHDHPFEDEMLKVKKAGKVYKGPWPKFDGESGPEFLNRMHKWASQGVLVTNLNNGFEEDGELDTQEKVLEYWYSL